MGQQQLLVGEHAAHDVLGRLDPVDPEQDLATRRSRPAVPRRRHALGRGRLGQQSLVVGRQRRHEGAAGPPGRQPVVAGPEPGLPVRGVEAAGPEAGQTVQQFGHGVVGQHPQHVGVGEGDVVEVHGGQVGSGLGQHPPQQGEVVVLHQHGRNPVPPARSPRRPWPGCSDGSPPRPPANGGRTGAGGAGRRDGDGSTTAWCWRSRRRPAGRCRRPPPPAAGCSCVVDHEALGHRLAVRRPHGHRGPGRLRVGTRQQRVQGGDQPAAGRQGLERRRRTLGRRGRRSGTRVAPGSRPGGWASRGEACGASAPGRPAARRPLGAAARPAGGCGGCARPGRPGRSRPRPSAAPRRSAGPAPRRTRRRSPPCRRPSGGPPSPRPGAGARRTARGRAARAPVGPPVRSPGRLRWGRRAAAGCRSP